MLWRIGDSSKLKISTNIENMGSKIILGAKRII